jgi:hypothetical protein
MSLRAQRLLLAAGLVLFSTEALNSQPATFEPKNPAPSVSPAEIQKLIEQLGDDKFLNRERASKRLLLIGKAAVPALRDATRSMDAEVACRAQRILADMQNHLPYLLEALKDPDVQVRRDAAAGLERLGPNAKEGLTILLEALKDKEESVRDAAIGAVLAIDADNPAVADVVPTKAHVQGKYTKLVRRLRIPEDRQSYSDFRDYGFYQQCDLAGHINIPAGYWVYVYPYWYVWREQANK